MESIAMLPSGPAGNGDVQSASFQRETHLFIMLFPDRCQLDYKIGNQMNMSLIQTKTNNAGRQHIR